MPTSATPAATAARLTPGTPQAKFGLIRPFSQDQARDFAQGFGDDLLASRVGQVIGSAGEFPWRPDLTSFLDRVRNVKQGPMLDELCRVYVGMALSKFLPEVTAVRVDASRVDRTLTLLVTCSRTSNAINAHPPTSFQVRASLST